MHAVMQDFFHGLVAVVSVFCFSASIIFQRKGIELREVQPCILIQFFGGELRSKRRQTAAIGSIAVAGVLAFGAGIMRFQVIIRVTVLNEQAVYHLLCRLVLRLQFCNFFLHLLTRLNDLHNGKTGL